MIRAKQDTKKRVRDPAVISYTMSRIRSKDTAIEMRLRRALWAEGFRYRKHYKDIPGTPDIAFPGAKVAVFCDSRFWHGRDWEKRKNKLVSNRDYWIRKIERNMERDKKVNKNLARSGWLVLRFWDTDIEKKLDECVERIKKALDARRNSG